MIFIVMRAAGYMQDLKVRAYWDAGTLAVRKGDSTNGPLSTRVAIQISNIGASRAIVICKPNRLVYVASISDSRDCSLLYNVDFEIGVNSTRSVPSVSDLKIVELDPGESTEFWCDARLSTGTKVDAVKLTYKISESIAKRFRVSLLNAECTIERQGMRLK